MKFIKKIELNNFQSHKYSVLELDPYLNVIVGPSDSGKSSIIRAIKWVLFNEPSGDFFIREGESEASVILSFSDGSRVTRLRSKSKNAYIINYSNGEELILNGFGVNVPVEVEEITEVSKVPFDQNSKEIVNIADQLEGPFLLSEKNSTKAFVIGGLAGVDIVDDSISELLKELRNLNIEDRRLDSNIEDINSQLEKFDELEETKLLFDKVKDIHKDIVDKENKLKELKYILNKYNSLIEEKKSVDSMLESLKNLDKAKSLYIDLYENMNLYIKYTNLNNRVTSILKEKDYMTKINNKFKDLEKVDIIKSGISSEMDLYNTLYKKYREYNKLKDEKNIVDKYIVKLKPVDSILKLIKNINSYNNLYKNLASYNDAYLDIIKRKNIGLVYVDKFKNIDKAIEKRSLLDSELDRYSKLSNINKNYRENNIEKNKIDNILEEYNKIIEGKTDEYKNVLLDAEVCPTCFSKIDSHVINNIVEGLNKD